MIWGAAIVMAILSVLVILWPMIRTAPEARDRSDHALAIFKDQLAEVERDQSRGVISGSEAEAAGLEIKRRMLAASRSKRAAKAGGGKLPLVIAAIAVPILAAGVYNLVGSPTIVSQPFAEREQEQTEATEIAELAARVRTKLLEQPNGGETRGWFLLSQTYMRMGRYDGAVDALGRIADRDEADATIHTAYAEALVSADSGTVTPVAQTQIDIALALEPQNPRAIYYNALGLGQRGKVADAHALLLARLETAEAGAGWIAIYVDQANEFAADIGAEPVSVDMFAKAPKGPTQEEVEAAAEMDAEDRKAFINSMVEQLAGRLQENPDNLEGWLRLAQAYTVLERYDDARKAYESAAPLVKNLPDSDPRKQAVTDGLAQ